MTMILWNILRIFFNRYKNGADYNDWNINILVNDIKQLLSQSSLEYILLDYSFAYKNDKDNKAKF